MNVHGSFDVTTCVAHSANPGHQSVPLKKKKNSKSGIWLNNTLPVTGITMLARCPSTNKPEFFCRGKKEEVSLLKLRYKKKYKMFCNNINKGLGRDDAMIIR